MHAYSSMATTAEAEDPRRQAIVREARRYFMAEGYAAERYTASQGVCLGRAGVVALLRDATGQVWVGGESVTCIDGTVTL